MSIGFTVTGHGGISPAVAGFMDHQFFFIDDGGGIPFANLSPFGITNCGMTGGCSSGSYAVSSPFHLDASQILEVTLSYLSADAPHYDTGQCYLLSSGAAGPLLFSAYGGEENVNILNILPLGPGVTLNPPTAEFLGNTVPLGGITYGPQRHDEALDRWIVGGSIPWVTSSWTATAAGDYQLLVLVYNTQINAQEAALAVSSVKCRGQELICGPAGPYAPTNLEGTIV